MQGCGREAVTLPSSPINRADTEPKKGAEMVEALQKGSYEAGPTLIISVVHRLGHLACYIQIRSRSSDSRSHKVQPL